MEYILDGEIPTYFLVSDKIISDDGYVYNKEKFKKYISFESYLNKKEMDYIITKIKEEYKVKENELEIVNK